jgi:hypothetical protein
MNPGPDGRPDLYGGFGMVSITRISFAIAKRMCVGTSINVLSSKIIPGPKRNTDRQPMQTVKSPTTGFSRPVTLVTASSLYEQTGQKRKGNCPV